MNPQGTQRRWARSTASEELPRLSTGFCSSLSRLVSRRSIAMQKRLDRTDKTRERNGDARRGNANRTVEGHRRRNAETQWRWPLHAPERRSKGQRNGTEGGLRQVGEASAWNGKARFGRTLPQHGIMMLVCTPLSDSGGVQLRWVCPALIFAGRPQPPRSWTRQAPRAVVFPPKLSVWRGVRLKPMASGENGWGLVDIEWSQGRLARAKRDLHDALL